MGDPGHKTLWKLRGPSGRGAWAGALRSPPFTEHLGKEKEDQVGLGRA